MFWRWLVRGILLATLALGCSSAGERGKNKFADRPTSGAEAKK